MSEASGFDAALRDPSSDLLAIAPYAKTLAQFITRLDPPFTIGVYGEWGSGKTTFVRFVETYLREAAGEQVEFVVFEAWPFKTSDDLWRALVQKIAKQLYGAPDTEPPVPDTTADPAEPVSMRLGRLLRKPSFYTSRPRPEPPPFAEYHDILGQLDDTMYGGSRRSDGDGRTLVEESMVAATLQGAIAALGSLSPLVAAMRAFFGDAKADVAGLLRREKNETTRRRIRSVDEFRKVLRNIFDAKAKGKRVIVFIDDLDRCMPEAVLDLLEALKIFLGEIPCMFIVAADEQIIGEGLRLRYKELLEHSGTSDAQRALAKKGKQYFEKIIQLGIHVPEHSVQEVHKFIAVQFPQWLPATDLIQTAVGTNPRRLKQYCNYLSYKFLVSQAADVSEVTEDPRLLNKLIELQSWDPDTLRRLRELAAENDYAAILEALEKCLHASAPDQPRSTAEDEIKNETALEIYTAVISGIPLYRLWTSEPSFAKCAAKVVAGLSSFVDVVPVPGSPTMLESHDRLLMRVLESGTRIGELSAPRLLTEDFVHLFAIEAEDPDVAAWLVALAARDDWQEQMRVLEAALENPAGSDGKPEGLADQIAARAKSKNDDRLRKLLLSAPRCSSVLAEAVTAWDSVRATVAGASKDSSRLSANSRAAAAYASVDGSTRNGIEESLSLRLNAADYFIKLRKFVKLDSLAICWPDLAQLLRKDMAGIRTFESNVVDPDQRPQDLPAVWQPFLKDEQLVAFLRLRPLLRDIFSDEVSKFIKLTESVSPPPEVLTAAERPGAAAVSSLDARPASALPYKDVQLVITGRDGRYGVSINVGEAAAMEKTVIVDLQSLAEMKSALDELPSVQPEPASPTREGGQRPPDATERVRDIGSRLYGTFFVGNVAKTMAGVLQNNTHRRIQLSVPADLAALPWEALYVSAPFKVFLGLTTQYSLVRIVGNTVPRPRLFASPLRILAFFANPTDLPLLKLTQELDLLQRVIAPATRAGRIVLDVLQGADANHTSLQRALRMGRPHIFHFAGHGFYSGNSGGLVFENASTGRLVAARDVATILRDANVPLAVLSGCQTGRSSASDIGSSVAGSLAEAGVPCVIGTVRDITDEAALLFTREFYRSLMDGFTVEASLIEARKAQSVERWDWSAFALFSNGANLDDLKLDLDLGSSRRERHPETSQSAMR